MASNTTVRFSLGIGFAAAILVAVLPAAERGGGMRQPLPPVPSAPTRSVPQRHPPVQPGVGRRAEPAPINDGSGDGSAAITHRGIQYMVSGGRWYAMRGSEWVEVLPPAGAMVRELPEGYIVRWIGGVPYFYADGFYYLWRARSKRYELLQAAPVEERDPVSQRPEAGREVQSSP
jgi:hypothetical protein